MRVIPDIERIPLQALIAQYGLEATVRALAIAASEHGESLDSEELNRRYQTASSYLYDRAANAPSVRDL